MKKIFSLLSCLAVFLSAVAQETFPVNGVHDPDNLYYAFTNATIFTDHNTKLENATLLVHKGKIERVGTNVQVPEGTVVHNLQGKYIYPGLIDAYSTYGIPEPKKEKEKRGPQMERKTEGAFAWNDALNSHINASELFHGDEKSAEKLRKLGFTAVQTLREDGIARGTSAFVLLGDEKDNEQMVAHQVAAHYSFDKGSSTQDYPGSLMGSIALLRQTYLDADWYQQQAAKTKEYNLSLEAFNGNQKLPQIFEVKDLLTTFRADKVGDEFGKQYIIKGTGKEYQRIDAIKKTGAKFIVPLNFPAAYDVEDPYDAHFVTLEDMKHWELAPTNLAALEKAGIEFSITSADIEDDKYFWKYLRKSIENGLSESTALKALTTAPAAMLGVADKVGTLEKGKLANFIITSDSLFKEKSIIHQNWIKGKEYTINPLDIVDLRGKYKLVTGTDDYDLEIKGEQPSKTKAQIKINDTTKLDVTLNLERKLVTLAFAPDKETGKNIRLSGHVMDNGNLKGDGQLVDGSWVKWMATRYGEAEEKSKKDSAQKTMPEELGKVTYPFLSYGWEELPRQKDYLIKNATVWTNEDDGILENTDVLISDGKIKKVGKNIQAGKAEVIDGTGKHLTCGIVDEHSHIAISRGVNEGSQAVTAEVSIGDVVNSEDINLYRQLAGGVTAAQLLHGSANPIGGQSGLIKFRWGQLPEQMKIDNTDGFIKFALGENVKQSNWGDFYTERFPQTRMGVEQVFMDAFYRAKEYEKKWKTWNSLSSRKKREATMPRKNLELEALLEVLNKKRFITCHSYIQSEINMLMHVADSFGIRVNTFTHILEGYKVADKMREHGAGGSTFSDWWAYKFEVNDAIPYNAALMHEQGVLTAINSDDPEMGRRLNQEAAKAVKYGEVSEEDAWKMVTLNPAKLLHLDERMGSIKEGKDGDVVLWSDHPLSIYARAEKTFVDGICYFDLERDKQLRQAIDKERTRLIQKMIIAKRKGEPTQKPEKKEEKHYHCDTLEP